MTATKVVIMDESGAIIIPRYIRNLLKTNEFRLKFENKEIILKPVLTWKDMFGSMKNIDLEKFKKQHEEDLR